MKTRDVFSYHEEGMEGVNLAIKAIFEEDPREEHGGHQFEYQVNPR